MLLTRWKKRLFVCLILCVIGLAVLLCSQHRLRLIAGSFVRVDSVEAMQAAPLASSAIRFPAVTPSVLYPRPTANDAVGILRAFDNSHAAPVGDALPIVDDPDTCLRALRESRPIHCYNVDIGAAHMLARFGFYVRLWDLSGKEELGGFGHNLIEIWDVPASAWRAIDPYYHCYFTRGASDSLIGFATLRHALLAGDTSLRAVRYFEYPNERTLLRVIEELRFLAPGAMLHANNDFTWRYRHRYDGLMPLAPLLDRLPLRVSRGARTLLMGSNDTRYVVQDAASPHYPFGLLRSAAWLLGLGAIASGLLLIAVAIRSQLGGRHSSLRRPVDPASP